MKKEQMDTLNDLLLKARKKININDVKYDKNGVPCSITVDKDLHNQIKDYLLQNGPQTVSYTHLTLPTTSRV